MNDEKTAYRPLGKIARWLLIVAGVLLLLGVLVRLSLRFAPVHEWARGQAESIVSGELDATLSIDRLEGDLWREARLTGVRLTGGRLSGTDSLVSADTLYVRYNLLSLLQSVFEVHTLTVSGLRAHLEKREEQWNVMQVLPEAEGDTASGDPFAFRIGDLQVREGNVRVSPAPDSAFTVQQIGLRSSIGFYGEEDYELTLQSLEFLLHHPALADPLAVETSAAADPERVTLERLLLQTGNSVIRSSASVATADTAGRFDLAAEPLDWRDLAHYTDEPPVTEDLKMELELRGSARDFTATVRAESPSLQGFRLSGTMGWDSTLVLRTLSLDIASADVAALTGDTLMPRVQALHLESEGRIAVGDYRRGALEGSWRTGLLAVDTLSVDRTEGSFALRYGSGELDLTLQRNEQTVQARAELEHLWEERPEHAITADFRRIDPGFWTGDTALSGTFSARLELAGEGFSPGREWWTYRLDLEDGSYRGRSYSGGVLEGRFNSGSAVLNSQVSVPGGNFALHAELQNLEAEPQFTYDLSAADVNLGELLAIDNFTTMLHISSRGEGSGNSLETLQLDASFRIDTSVVNGERIESFAADFRVTDSVVTFVDAALRSTIAEGTVDGRLHLLRQYDPANEMSLDLEIRDPGSLAPLANAEELMATGSVRGRLYPAGGDHLMFTGSLELEDINFDSVVTAASAAGDLEVRLTGQQRYSVNVDLSSPAFRTVVLEDLHLESSGTLDEEGAAGRFLLDFRSTVDGTIVHGGTFALSGDTIRVTTDRFDLSSPIRTLRLQKPFSFRYDGTAAQMDTMRIRSEDRTAFLELAVPHADSLRQEIWLRGRELNTAVIQNTILSEALFEGMLSGQLEVQRTDTALTAGGNIILTGFDYRGAAFDTLNLGLDITGERLRGDLSLWDGGEELVTGNLDIPFRAGDPETFPDSFYGQEVSGKLTTRAVAVSRFDRFLENAGILNTSGILTFSGSLEGTAGAPRMTARGTLNEAVLSGVELDSVSATVSWLDQSQLELEASVMSLRQEAAEVTAQVPFGIDMRRLSITLPEAGDSVRADIVTRSFNLAALNDFVDRQTIREVSGELNGSVRLTGTVDSLNSEGELWFQNGAFRLIPAGIRVDHIRSTVQFHPDEIRLTDFRARSGSGEMTAEGTIQLERLKPGEMDLRVRAGNFKLANTSRYNANIDMDARAQGTPLSPAISGELTLLNGFVELDNFGERSVESVELEGDGADEPGFSVYDSLSLDMDVSFNRRFFVRNERYLEMEVELGGQVDLLKEQGGELQIFGSISATGGYAYPLGKRFDLEEGTVQFSGDPANPAISMRTLYEPPQSQQEVKIWYVIGGTVEDPEFRYESQPEMELENIVSYTLFGQPFYALDSWKQMVAGSGSNASATDVALDVLLDRVESLATRRLGIDVVQIDNKRTGGESGTAVTTGWYLSSRVFFAIQNVISGTSPDTSFLLEYLLRDNLKLIISQGNDSHQGIDLQWEYDY